LESGAAEQAQTQVEQVCQEAFEGLDLTEQEKDALTRRITGSIATFPGRRSQPSRLSTQLNRLWRGFQMLTH
jgi:hypothetical protein